MTSKQTKVVGITLAAVLLALVTTTVVTTTTAYAVQDETGTGNNAKHFGGISNQYHFVANSNIGSNALGQEGR